LAYDMAPPDEEANGLGNGLIGVNFHTDVEDVDETQTLLPGSTSNSEDDELDVQVVDRNNGVS